MSTFPSIIWDDLSRNGHDSTQGEQHEQPVEHLEMNIPIVGLEAATIPVYRLLIRSSF